MNLKTILIVAGLVGIAVALADLSTGKSSTPILPAVVGNELTQEIDVALLVSGAIGLFYAVSYA
jgi:hypothetical protein